MRLRLILILAATAVSWAGQSAVTSTGNLTNGSVPNRGSGNPWRLECYIHDWDDNPTGRVMTAAYLGADVQFSSGTTLRFNPNNLTGGAIAVIDIPITSLPGKQLYFRAQYDGALTDTFEGWDRNGAYVTGSTSSTTGTTWVNTGTGMQIGGTSMTRSTAFCRTHSTTVPLNSRPPTTFDNTARLDEWKLDGALTNAVRAFDLTGTPSSYVATPFQNVIAKPQTFVRPVWGDQVSFRAGTPNQLDGSNSFSQADGSNTVNCFWQQTGGPAGAPLAVFDSRTSCTPTVTGLVFGSYTWQLTVTDAASNSATSSIVVGSVATDSNGVVIPADPNVTKIFGRMIAFGKSPWGYMDSRAQAAVTLNQARYAGKWPPAWATPMAGTLSTDLKFDRVRTTLSADITSTATTINVTSAAGLDLSTFPTVIGIGGFPSYSDEEVLICSAAGNVLTVCFDGRGYSPDAQGVARAWTSGTNIYQRVVTGSSSTFLADFCPAGKGWPGAIVYNTGTVAVTAGSTTITGTGTTWTAAMNGSAIRIQGTYSTGTPFIFQAYFTQTSATTATLSRAYPSGADTNSGRAYHLTASPKYLSMNYLRADATTGRAPVYLSHCETNTAMYWRAGSEYLSTQGSGGTGLQSGITYSGDTLINASNNGSYQYYDEGAAGYALWFRSGWAPALTQARTITDYWLSSPWIDDGYPNVAPRNRTLTGSFIAAALDGRTSNWYGLRRNASQGASYANNCFYDLREVAYAHSWTALAAFLDPDNTQKANWVAAMPTALAWDEACKGAANDYKQYYSGGEGGIVTGATGFAVNAINGSTAITGTNIPSTYCLRTAGGTASIVSGATQITGASISIASGAPGNIVISGTSGGNPLILKMQYSGSGTTVALSGVWPGDSGTINFYIEASSGGAESYILSVSPYSTADPAYGKMYACQWNNSGSITLIRPYEGPTGTAYLQLSNLVGVGTQPFIASIKTKSQEWGVQATSGATQTSYQANKNALANWIYNNGLDAPTGGMFYGVGFANCNPILTATGTDAGYNFRNTECNYFPNVGGKQTARPLLAEGASALVAAYEANPTAPVKSAIDQYYSNLFGQAYVSGVPSAEGGINNEFLFDNSLTIGKWYGFHYGLGMAHQWPAVRLGGVTPPVLVAKPIKARLADIPGAVDIVVDYLAPSGLVSTSAPCTSAACTFDVNTVQGTYLYRVRYRNGSAANLAVGQYLPVR